MLALWHRASYSEYISILSSSRCVCVCVCVCANVQSENDIFTERWSTRYIINLSVVVNISESNTQLYQQHSCGFTPRTLSIIMPQICVCVCVCVCMCVCVCEYAACACMYTYTGVCVCLQRQK